MSPEQWERVVELFDAAREKSGADRVALLDSASSDDPSLRPLVEQMLREHDVAGSFMNESPLCSLLAGKHASTTAGSGTRFGRYELLTLIGRGGMGQVWAAQDSELDRQVALKFLTPEAAFGRAVERLRREAKTVSALNHPNIVTVHEVIAYDGAPIIVMELVDGHSLREMSGTAQPVNQWVDIALQIARALTAAHAGGIIHGDIKPENILLRRDGYVKVLDFGLARSYEPGESAVSSRHLPGATLPGGTLRYMSPEQARGESLSPATDIFSFGLVLFELATGQHAFQRDSPAEAIEAILTEQAPSPSSKNSLVPPCLDSLILSMLAHNPAARPSAEKVAEMLSDMQRLSEKSDLPNLKSRLTHRKWVAVGLLTLATGLATWFWGVNRTGKKEPAFYQVTTLVPENRATAAAISPDGKWTAYANVDGIFLKSMQGGKTNALRAPAAFTVNGLAWFADGTKLAASGMSTLTDVPSVWMVSATGAPPRLLREQAERATPSPDGASIAFITRDQSAIWVMELNTMKARQVVRGPPVDTFPLVFWSPDGGRLAYQRRHYVGLRPGAVPYLDPNYERSYESVELSTGRVVARVPEMWIQSASVLRDNRLIFLRWYPPGWSYLELWEVRTNPASGAFLGSPRKVASLPPVVEGMSVTADGKQVVLLRTVNQNPVFVGDFDAREPRITNIRRLTLDERSNYPHAWTADSRAVIFESDRNGNFDLFKQYLDQRIPDTIVATPLTEVLAQLSPDGRSVLYAAGVGVAKRGGYPEAYRLMRVPIEGGKPEEVPIGGPLDGFRCALGAGKRCVLRTTISREYYVFNELDPVFGKGRELARTKWMPGHTTDWSVSPDGTQLAIPNHDSQDARIRVLRLDSSRTGSQEHEVRLPGLANLLELAWAADGQGWFVNMDTSVGRRLLFVYRDGRFVRLGNIHGCPVPSPDGHHLAFVDRIATTNVWTIDRH